MKGLIGCEESQAVTIAFRNKGHEFYSCDLKSCSGGHTEWHIQGDVIQAITSQEWDFIGLHPVCTKMALSGNRTYGIDKPRHNERIEAVEWTISLWELAKKHSPKVYMENPMGAMNTDKRLPPPQIVQPYFFGDEARKTTCLWLHGLPKLFHNPSPDLFNDSSSHVEQGEFHYWTDGKTGKLKRQPKWYADAFFNNKDPTKRSEIRSKTFPGIANAMAQQWTNL